MSLWAWPPRRGCSIFPAAPAPTTSKPASQPVVVEAYVNDAGQVYDYRILSGPTDPATRSEVENLLLFSVFEPARFFGQPVRGLAVLSFSGRFGAGIKGQGTSGTRDQGLQEQRRPLVLMLDWPFFASGRDCASGTLLDP